VGAEDTNVVGIAGKGIKSDNKSSNSGLHIKNSESGGKGNSMLSSSEHAGRRASRKTRKGKVYFMMLTKLIYCTQNSK
jgi:hypothetical protein